jgi:hypothetical protein
MYAIKNGAASYSNKRQEYKRVDEISDTKAMLRD